MNDIPKVSDRRATLTGKPVAGRLSAALATEAPVTRGFGQEVLVHTAEAIDLSRAERGLPLLVNHDTRDALPIGRVENVHLADDRKLRGEIVFSQASERGREVAALVEEGTVGDVSVQYRIDDWERGASEDEVRITRWTPLEVSIVSVPADGATGIGRSHAPQPEVHTVPDETTTPELDTSGADIIAQVKNRATAGRSEGAADERKRLLAIDELTGTLRRSLPDLTADLDALAQAAKEDGSITAERHQSLALELIGGAGFPLELGARDASPQPLDMPRAPSQSASREAAPVSRFPAVQTPGASHRGFVQPGDDAGERAMRGMELSLLERAGTKLEPEQQEGNSFRGWSLLDMARECLEMSGKSVRGMSSEQVARAAIGMSGRRAISPGTAEYVTADFPAVTENVVTKRVNDAYAAAEVTWQNWCSSTQVPDFKQFTIPAISQISSLPVVAENIAYTDLTQTDSKEVATLQKRGGLISFSWEAITNDDQRMFARTSSDLGEAAARTIDENVYGLLTLNAAAGLSGPVLTDTFQLFDIVNHLNVGVAPLALAGIVEARTAIARQTDSNGELLGITLRHIIVPEELRDEADNLATSVYVPWVEGATPQTTRINTVRSTFTVTSTVRLTDVTEWYAASAAGGTIEVAFLNGNVSPAIFRDDGWDIDALHYKIRHPSIAYAVDYRGLYFQQAP